MTIQKSKLQDDLAETGFLFTFLGRKSLIFVLHCLLVFFFQIFPRSNNVVQSYPNANVSDRENRNIYTINNRFYQRELSLK